MFKDFSVLLYLSAMLEFIKKYKFPYVVYNFFQKGKLKHNIPLFEKYGLKKKYYSSISSADFEGMDSPLNTYDALNSKNEMPFDENFKALPEETEIDSLIESNKANWRYRNKIMFSHKISELINNVGNGKLMHDVLKTLMGKPVQLFQSINFITGSNQRTHSDSIHMTTFPYGNLIAVWVALEDIKADSGPLHYYSGSHKWPYLMNKDFGNSGNAISLGKMSYEKYEDKIEEIVQKSDYERKNFLAKKGDILIWHANLLHGGEEVANPESTRKSMVFHYYATDAICFHEITQRPSLM